MNYDCFLFSQELEILELRLRILENVVDKFVIGECSKSFTQLDKPMVFKKHHDRFSRWITKIIYVEIPAHRTANAIDQETYQRDFLRKGLPDSVSNLDLVAVNDCDEIPNPIAWTQVKADPIVGLEVYFSQFFLNLEVREIWPHMRLCRGDFAKSHSMSKIRWSHPDEWLLNGGWHFNCVMSAEDIARKCHWFSHAEGSPHEWKVLWQNPEALRAFRLNAAKDPKYVKCQNSSGLLPRQVLDRWSELTEKGLILP